MAKISFDLFPGQRVDITVLMADADKVIEIFKLYNARFAKKFTTIDGDSPSTITFKDITSNDKLSSLFNTLDANSQDFVGDVHIRFVNRKRPIENKPAP